MNEIDVVSEFVEARIRRDEPAVSRLLADDLEWTTPRGRTYDKETILPHLVENEDEDELHVARENHRFEAAGDGRVLVRFETVYAWSDGLENRVPSCAVFELRDGLIVRARYYLNRDAPG